MSEIGATAIRRRARLTRETRRIVVLALPLIANNIAFTTMTLADTIMAGQISAVDLGAVGVGGGVWAAVFLFGFGVMMALNPLTAHELGRRTPENVGTLTRQGSWLALALAVIGFTALQFSTQILTAFGIDAEVLPKSAGYLRAIAWGLPGAYLYLALRFTSEGMGRTLPVMFAALFGLVLNVAGNYVLMYGKLGFPALGAVGCGWASAFALTAMYLAMLIYFYRNHRVYGVLRVFERFEWPDWGKLREVLALGVPIGGSVLAEVGLFSSVAIIMGRLGTLEVAAHQIALNYAATMFMVPLAVHSATTVRVGQALGSGRRRQARVAGLAGIISCGLFMTLSALVLLVFRDVITGWYSNDAAVREIAVALLLMAAVFQVSDGIQVGAAGALRGYKDTSLPFFINFFSYWIVGFPLAYAAGVYWELGTQAVWAALAAALTVAAVLLSLRFWWVSRRELAGHVPVTTPG